MQIQQKFVKFFACLSKIVAPNFRPDTHMVADYIVTHFIFIILGAKEYFVNQLQITFGEQNDFPCVFLPFQRLFW